MKKVASCVHSVRTRGLFCLVFCGTLLGLTGCQNVPQKVTVDFAEPKVAAAAPTAQAALRPATGSIYQPVSYRPTFEDSRARHLGDIVTIMIVESLAASQVSKSTVNRNTSIDTAITPPLPGILGPDLKNLEMAAKTNNDFSGKGGTRPPIRYRLDYRHGH